MHKYLVAAVMLLASAYSPAMAKCHGHSANGHWDLNLDSWSSTEVGEIYALIDQLKAIDPSTKTSAAEVAGNIDQAECAGVSHSAAVSSLIGFSKKVVEAGNPSTLLPKDLMELADPGVNVGSPIVDEEARAKGIEMLKKAFAAQQPAVKG